MRRVAVVVIVVLATLGLAGPASAGGPTSVLLASPSLDKAAGLYNDDGAYSRLAAAVGVERSVVADPKVPSGLGVGPGSDAINVTWLAHDVWIWRVDRVHVEPDGKVWLNTMLTDDSGELPYEPGGVWHQAAQPAQLKALLAELGLWRSDAAKPKALNEPEAATITGGGDDSAAPPADEPATATTTTTPIASTSPSPWLFAAIALLGLALGFAVRPALALAARLRGRDPRQQLIDAGVQR